LKAYRHKNNLTAYFLKIGGKIIFYVCTLSKIETSEVIENFLTLYKNKYKINSVNIEKIFEDISPEIKKENFPKPAVCFEIMPYYFKSEGATVCSIIKTA